MTTLPTSLSNLNLTTFNKIYPLLVQKYSTLIPDPNVNTMDKINSIIDSLNHAGKLTNDLVDNWNKVMAWVMSDGLTTDVSNKIDSMVAAGTFDQIFQKDIAPSLGNLSNLQTTDKSSLVNSLNEVNGKKMQKGKDVIIVAKQNGDYATIMDAVNNANDSVSDPVTILIMPGVYFENVYIAPTRHISLIGVNKRMCVIQDDSGQYSKPPLMIAGNALVKGLTITSTHNNDSVTPVDQLRSYAVHCDEDAGQTATIEFQDCVMTSYQNAAFGCGLHANQTVILRNCEMYSYTPTASTMTTNGSLFVHNSINSGVQNQVLIVKDCYAYSANDYAAYINDANFTAGDGQGNTMNCLFTNVKLMSGVKYIENSLHVDVKPSNNYFSGCIQITWDSLGNNCSKLNNNSNWWYEQTSLQNGVQTFGSTFDTPAYSKDIHGTVHIKGVVKNIPSPGNVIFNLPIGYRPAKDRIVSVPTNDGTGTTMGTMFVKSTGDVCLVDNIRSGFTSIECSFPADK